jgi:hypothetical protein
MAGEKSLRIVPEDAFLSLSLENSKNNTRRGHGEKNPGLSHHPREQRLDPALLIALPVAIVSPPVTMAAIVGAIVILVTVGVSVIVSVAVVPVIVVAPVLISLIPKRVSVTVMAPYSKS